MSTIENIKMSIAVAVGSALGTILPSLILVTIARLLK
jgi:hypothetical protein